MKTSTMLPGLGALLLCGCCRLGGEAVVARVPIPTADFYVATDGDNAWSGTLPTPNVDRTDGPFASLERARDALRAKREVAGGSRGGTVVIRGGIYPRADTFTLKENDSGTPDAPVTYQGCPGEVVRLSGGQSIPGRAFQPIADRAIMDRLPPEGRDAVVQAELGALGITDFGKLQTYGHAVRTPEKPPELFVDGEAMRPARWPNEGWVRTGSVIDRGSVWGSNVPGQPALREKPDRGAVFEFDDPRLARWQDAEDLWLFGFWWWDWADQAVKVASVDGDKNIIKTADAHTYGYRTGRRFYAFNLLEEIDEPGECYLNRLSGVLYLYPPCPLAAADIEFSHLKEPMVALDEASHIILRDLILETSRGMAIAIREGTSNRVIGCTIRKTAEAAIVISGGVGHQVLSCDIHDTNGGISVAGGDRKTLTPGKHLVDNCHIHRYSRLSKTSVFAISLRGCGLTARHNLIHDAPHVAIGFHGNDHLIEFNEICDVCQETSDAGVIYTGRNWSMRGNILRYNFIHDIVGIGGSGAQGIYLDDCFSSAEMIGNVFYRMNDLPFLLGGGRDNVIVNNVAIETGPLRIDSRGLGWAKRSAGPGGGLERSLKEMPYTEEPWASRYPTLVSILDDDPAVPKGNVVQRNVFVRTPGPKLDPPVREFGTVSDNWETEADPGFIDAGAMDFRFRPNAAVFEHVPGFQEIPFGEIGLYPCADRPVLPPLTPVLAPAAGGFVGRQTVEIKTRSRDAVIHYTTDGSPPTSRSPRYAGPILLTDSTTINAAAFSGNAAGHRSSTLKAHYEAMHLDGDGGVPLSRLPMLSYSGYCEPKRDANMAAAPIELGGRTYQRGLFLHPGETPDGGRGHAEFAMAGGLADAERLKATVGIEESMRTRGTVVFIVEGRRAGTWQELLRTPVMVAGKPPRDIDVDVSGCDRVRLVVSDGGDNIHCDHAAWGDARFTAR